MEVLIEICLKKEAAIFIILKQVGFAAKQNFDIRIIKQYHVISYFLQKKKT
jgi:hypothetical protein